VVKTISGLVVVRRAMDVVVKSPPSAWLMHQMSNFCVLSRPKPLHAASRALLAPFADYDVPFVVGGAANS
jgi:hypothetical protein